MYVLINVHVCCRQIHVPSILPVVGRTLTFSLVVGKPSIPIRIFFRPFSRNKSLAISLFSKYLKNRHKSLEWTPKRKKIKLSAEAKLHRKRQLHLCQQTYSKLIQVQLTETSNYYRMYCVRLTLYMFFTNCWWIFIIPFNDIIFH